MPQQLVVGNGVADKARVLALARHLKQVDKVERVRCMRTRMRVLHVALDHAKDVGRGRDGLDVAAQRLVLAVDRVNVRLCSVRQRSHRDFNLAERLKKLHLVGDSLQRVDERRLAHAKVVRDARVKQAARLRDFGARGLAGIDKLFNRLERSVTVQHLLLGKLAERRLGSVILHFQHRLFHRANIENQLNEALNGLVKLTLGRRKRSLIFAWLARGGSGLVAAAGSVVAVHEVVHAGDVREMSMVFPAVARLVGKLALEKVHSRAR